MILFFPYTVFADHAQPFRECLLPRADTNIRNLADLRSHLVKEVLSPFGTACRSQTYWDRSSHKAIGWSNLLSSTSVDSNSDNTQLLTSLIKKIRDFSEINKQFLIAMRICLVSPELSSCQTIGYQQTVEEIKKRARQARILSAIAPASLSPFESREFGDRLNLDPISPLPLPEQQIARQYLNQVLQDLKSMASDPVKSKEQKQALINRELFAIRMERAEDLATLVSETPILIFLPNKANLTSDDVQVAFKKIETHLIEEDRYLENIEKQILKAHITGSSLPQNVRFLLAYRPLLEQILNEDPRLCTAAIDLYQADLNTEAFNSLIGQAQVPLLLFSLWGAPLTMTATKLAQWVNAGALSASVFLPAADLHQKYTVVKNAVYSDALRASKDQQQKTDMRVDDVSGLELDRNMTIAIPLSFSAYGPVKGAVGRLRNKK